ncbi:MAG: hypothetical protein LUG21_04370 [Clostridiales bacterium]|nr:hypothetical protein [Clostridiales bacterium]
MKELTKTYSREIWVDNVKVIACVLVATGHFFQSMVLANVLPENNLNQWFEQAIYYFHVPLFFYLFRLSLSKA